VRKLVFEYPKVSPTKIAFMFRIVPEDVELLDKSITKDEIPESISLRGEHYEGYKEIFNLLRQEQVLEYLKNKELDDVLWKFVCKIIINYKYFRRNPKKLDEEIDNFLKDISKPLETYEVFVPIISLAIEREIKIDDVVIKKFDHSMFENLPVPSDDETNKMFNEIINVHFANKTVAIVSVVGNNHELICLRGREKVNKVLNVLRVILSKKIMFVEEQLLFRIGEIIIYRSNDSQNYGLYWIRDRKPIHLNIKELEERVEDYFRTITEIFENEDLSSEIKDTILRALTWVNKAILEEDLDLKIVFLSTALETILTKESDKRKGETLAYRMMILNSELKEPFVNPLKIFWIYELRSRVIHGSELGVATKDEYNTMLWVTTDVIKYALRYILDKKIMRHIDFIRALDTSPIVGDVLTWLDKIRIKEAGQIKEVKEAIQIKKVMEENIKEISS